MSRPLPIGVPLALLALALIGGSGLPAAFAVALIAFLAFALFAARKASRSATSAFRASYAGTRNLRSTTSALPELTPLLRMGDRRESEWHLAGVFPGGHEGSLSLHVYETDKGNSGGRPTGRKRFTVVFFRLPEVTGRALKLYGEPESLSKLETGSVGYGAMKRLSLESLALDRRFSIFYGISDDESWLHRLFAPSFIVWLSEHPPDGYAFQLWDGNLCGFVSGHLESAAELDALCETTARICGRLRNEVTEYN